MYRIDRQKYADFAAGLTGFFIILHVKAGLSSGNVMKIFHISYGM